MGNDVSALTIVIVLVGVMILAVLHGLVMYILELIKERG